MIYVAGKIKNLSQVAARRMSSSSLTWLSQIILISDRVAGTVEILNYSEWHEMFTSLLFSVHL